MKHGGRGRRLSRRPSRTNVTVLDGEPSRTSGAVLEGEETTCNQSHHIYPHLTQITRGSGAQEGAGKLWPVMAATTNAAATNLADLPSEESSRHVGRFWRVEELEGGFGFHDECATTKYGDEISRAGTEFVLMLFRRFAQARAIPTGGSMGMLRSWFFARWGWLAENDRFGRSFRAWPGGALRTMGATIRGSPGKQSTNFRLPRYGPKDPRPTKCALTFSKKSGIFYRQDVSVILHTTVWFTNQKGKNDWKSRNKRNNWNPFVYRLPTMCANSIDIGLSVFTFQFLQLVNKRMWREWQIVHHIHIFVLLLIFVTFCYWFIKNILLYKQIDDLTEVEIMCNAVKPLCLCITYFEFFEEK
jgi:hypothetical protein